MPKVNAASPAGDRQVTGAAGEIADEVTNAQLMTARQRHFDLLEQDLQYRSDVP